MKTRPTAKGAGTKTHRKIAINMPKDAFDKIAKRAKIDNVSFNQKAVELIDCGIFDYEESERYEGGD
jgi:hypothetical protein